MVSDSATKTNKGNAAAKKRFALALVVSCSAVLGSASLWTEPSNAISDSLKQGIADFNGGDYKAAEGHLGEALAREFDNAVLHYYLANTYVKLNKKDAAVKEFRIAYALEPAKEVGKLSKTALTLLGVDEAKKEEPAKPVAKAPPPPVNPTLDRTVNNLKDQVQRERERDTRTAAGLAGDTNSRAITVIDGKKQDALDALKYYRRGRLYQPGIPNDVMQQLDSLRGIYNQQMWQHMDSAGKRGLELQKTADNLQTLMTDKKLKNGQKINPVGTNLYIRNYQNDTTSGGTASASASASTSSSTGGTTAAEGAKAGTANVKSGPAK